MHIFKSRQEYQYKPNDSQGKYASSTETTLYRMAHNARPRPNINFRILSDQVLKQCKPKFGPCKSKKLYAIKQLVRPPDFDWRSNKHAGKIFS